MMTRGYSLKMMTSFMNSPLSSIQPLGRQNFALGQNCIHYLRLRLKKINLSMTDGIYEQLFPCVPHHNPYCLTDCCIFYQSAALPPLAAPVQTWKPTTANMNTFKTTAAVASVQIHSGSALLVFLTQQLEPDSGSR